MHINIDRVPGQSIQIEILNGYRNYDDYMHINIDRVLGQSHIEIMNGEDGWKHDLTFTLGDLNFRKMDGIFNVAVEGTSQGEAVKGELKGSRNKDVQVLQFELEKGNKKYIQIETKIKMDGPNIEASTKYAVLGGTIAGKVLLKLENGVFNFKHTDSTSDESVELTAKFVEGKVFEWPLDSGRTFRSNSKIIEKFLSQKYPYGAFNTRINKVTFVLKRWGIEKPSIDITVDHKIGGSMLIDANILGGLHLQGKRGDNAKNGRDVNLKVKKGGVQMFKITWSTEKINNKEEVKFILHNTLEVNPESMLYKNFISQYKILTPFTSRVGEFEIYVNKKDKNLLLNKFYIKGKVMKDGNKALYLLLTTNEKPYKGAVALGHLW